MGALIILIPLLIYLFAGLSVDKSQIKHPDDYFAAFKKVGQTEFASSSIAYGFQVSTIYPFLLWGASMFLFAPVINSFFWGIGILFFYFSFNSVSKYLGNGKTLHGIIGDKYGDNARVVASILTIIGFIGYIIAELWFGSRVLLSIFPVNNWIYLSIFVFIIIISFYLFNGGQFSSIRTDQLQLTFTYFGVFGVIIYLLFLVFTQANFISAELCWGSLVLLILIPIIAVLRRSKYISINNILDNTLNTLITVFFIIVFFLLLLLVIFKSQSLNLKNFLNLEGFGFAGLFSLILLPLCWQFVDLTNWQRLLSVETSEANSKINLKIKKGLLNYAIESPFTWVLFIVFGLLISTSFPGWKLDDVLIDFPRQLINSNKIIERFFGYTFILSIISIMLSTIDSFIMGIGFTYTYDINPVSRILLEKQGKFDSQKTKLILQKGKVFSFIVVLFASLLFVFFDKNIKGGGELFITLLLSFYSAALSFFPLVFGILFLKKTPNPTWSLASMLAGAISGVGTGIYATLYNPSYAWYPIILSLVVSSIIFVLGYVWSSK